MRRMTKKINNDLLWGDYSLSIVYKKYSTTLCGPDTMPVHKTVIYFERNGICFAMTI